MLTSLLPGLRELRAPLAAGYVWLVALWVAIEPHVPPEEGRHPVLRRVTELAQEASVLGTGLAITFVAFLVGAVSTELWDIPVRLALRVAVAAQTLVEWLELAVRTRSLPAYRLLSSRGWFSSAAVSGAGSRAVRLVMDERTRMLDRELRAAGAEWSAVAPTHDRTTTADNLESQTINELEILATRLMGSEPELYSQYDLRRAEYEFRAAIVPPLITLITLLTIEWRAAWAFAYTAVGLLLLQAAKRRQRSGDLLADALLLGRVESPAVERMERAVREATGSGPRRSAASSS